MFDSLATLLTEVQGRFLRYNELASVEDRTENVQAVRDRYVASLQEALDRLQRWQSLSYEARMEEYTEYVQRRERLTSPTAERVRNALADLAARETEISMAVWPDQLMYLRAAALAEIGEERAHQMRQFARGWWRDAEGSSIPDFTTWCARLTEDYQKEYDEELRDYPFHMAALESDLAFLSSVNEFLDSNTRSGVLAPPPKE